MNNNFDENSEFVRRPVQRTENTRQMPPPRRPQTPPQSGTAGNEQRSLGQRPQNPYRQQRPPQRQNASVQGHTGTKPRQNAGKVPREKAPREKRSKSGIIGNIVIFVIMLAALLILGTAIVLSSLHVSPEKESTLYTLVYGDGKSAEKVTSVRVNGVPYLNMTKISDMCSFTVSGNKSSLRFTADSGEYVEFMIGSVTAKVNGDIVNMEGAALIRENESVWIPTDFAETYFMGLDFMTDDKSKTLTIKRTEKAKDDDGNPIYASVSFTIKGSATVPSLPEADDVGEITDLGFVNDLSDYEQYMNPEDRDAYLILVNKTNSISSDYIPETLTPVENTRGDRAKEQMVECAEKALEALYKELYSAGYTDVTVTSAYRSYNKQVSLFNTYLQREMSRNSSLSEAEAKEIVLTYSAYPGTSEHQTGLCCDMHNLGSADVAFANKEAYTWLIENCYKFGFILRFPEDKTEITGYSFEPWHYRFVGRYHATRMHNLGMCLEEYTDYLANING